MKKVMIVKYDSLKWRKIDEHEAAILFVDAGSG